MRGRPTRSPIRQNIVDILFYLKKGYGYEIFKHYIALYPRCTMEVVYYHLKKGLQLGEFEVAEVRQEKGDYSWGPISEKTFYGLGPQSAPRQSRRLEKYFGNIPKD
jgi:hypothetical protein